MAPRSRVQSAARGRGGRAFRRVGCVKVSIESAEHGLGFGQQTGDYALSDKDPTRSVGGGPSCAGLVGSEESLGLSPTRWSRRTHALRQLREREIGAARNCSLRFGPVAERREELSQRDSDCGGESSNGTDADVSFTSFDAAYVVTVQVCSSGEFLLRDSVLPSKFSNPTPYCSTQVCRHSRHRGGLNTIGLHTIVFVFMSFLEPGAGQVECPLCSGRGTIHGRAFRRNGPVRYSCGLCRGAGSVDLDRIRSLQRLRDQMQRVADLMQIGDAESAGAASRIAARIARSMIPSE